LSMPVPWYEMKIGRRKNGQVTVSIKSFDWLDTCPDVHRDKGGS
jgi:hypothetical protein